MTADRETSRTLGAVAGLIVGWSVLWWIGWNGMIAAAIMGAGGAVLGGISGERIFDWRKS